MNGQNEGYLQQCGISVGPSSNTAGFAFGFMSVWICVPTWKLILGKTLQCSPAGPAQEPNMTGTTGFSPKHSSQDQNQLHITAARLKTHSQVSSRMILPRIYLDSSEKIHVFCDPQREERFSQLRQKKLWKIQPQIQAPSCSKNSHPKVSRQSYPGVL